MHTSFPILSPDQSRSVLPGFSFSRLWQGLWTPGCMPVLEAQGTFHWKGRAVDKALPMNTVVYALKWAHAVLLHVLLAIMKCPLRVLMENCLLDTQKEFHKASISHLICTHPCFLSACNGMKDFQIRYLISLLPFNKWDFIQITIWKRVELNESWQEETHVWLYCVWDTVIILSLHDFPTLR